jgi:DNA repair protein RecN (Recombination protein N)
MLQNLNISDLAVVKNLDLNLEQGLSVLTGETGAGKSILLTALGLALGDRADSSYIRPDCKRAEVNLEFDLSDADDASQWLLKNELDDGKHCLIRRVITPDGRSKAFINGSPVNLQTLQSLSEKLVEIHGQHAHLTLLKSEEQRRFLDESADNKKQLTELNAIFHQWKQDGEELQVLIQAATDQSEREELLRYQINELEQLDLENYNYAVLSEEHNTQANLGLILSNGQTQLNQLYENEQQSVNQMLGQAVSALSEISEFAPEINEINSQLTEAQIQIEEASQELRRYLDSQELDPQRLELLEEQISTIHNLSRKHQTTPEEIPELSLALKKELDNLTHSSERIEELKKSVAQSETQYYELAQEISKQRKNTASATQKQISTVINELGMPQGEFVIEVTKLEDSPPRLNGLDKIEFLVSANPGLPPRPLAKVASGGELSRISLAIQVSSSHEKMAPTMIFDEVDSGIGGGIAEIVGQKMRDLSKNRQVICVTHLPQVASQSHHHLFVAKKNNTDMTESTVTPLDKQERIAEVARMLGGVKMTEHTLNHAEEMLNLGSKN